MKLSNNKYILIIELNTICPT